MTDDRHIQYKTTTNIKLAKLSNNVLRHIINKETVLMYSSSLIINSAQLSKQDFIIRMLNKPGNFTISLFTCPSNPLVTANAPPVFSPFQLQVRSHVQKELAGEIISAGRH